LDFLNIVLLTDAALKRQGSLEKTWRTVGENVNSCPLGNFCEKSFFGKKWRFQQRIRSGGPTFANQNFFLDQNNVIWPSFLSTKWDVQLEGFQSDFWNSLSWWQRPHSLNKTCLLSASLGRQLIKMFTTAKRCAI
jgi:hypothetical protein